MCRKAKNQKKSFHQRKLGKLLPLRLKIAIETEIGRGRQKNGNGKHSDNGRNNEGKQRSDDRKRKRDDKSDDRKRKKSKYDSDEEDKKKKKDKHKSKEPVSEKSAPLWVRHSIHVKIRNKSLRGGAYYSKRASVIDILPGGKCQLKLAGSGEILDDIRQDDLETIVPGEGGKIIVVLGESKGQLGKVIEKEANRNKVHVQMDADLDIQTFSLDDVAEYMARD